MQNSKLTAKGPGYRRLSWANASASAATQSATGKQRHRFARYGARPVRCESISALKFLPYCRTSPHARGHGLLLTPTRGTTRVCPPQGQGRRTSRTAARHMWCQDPERHTLPDEERARQASLQVPWRQKHRAKNTERQSTDSGSSTEKVARLSRKGIDRICDCRAELLAMSEPRGGQEISGGTRHSTSSTDIALIDWKGVLSYISPASRLWTPNCHRMVRVSAELLTRGQGATHLNSQTFSIFLAASNRACHRLLSLRSTR